MAEENKAQSGKSLAKLYIKLSPLQLPPRVGKDDSKVWRRQRQRKNLSIVTNYQRVVYNLIVIQFVCHYLTVIWGKKLKEDEEK